MKNKMMALLLVCSALFNGGTALHSISAAEMNKEEVAPRAIIMELSKYRIHVYDIRTGKFSHTYDLDTQTFTCSSNKGYVLNSMSFSHSMTMGNYRHEFYLLNFNCAR